MTSKLLTCRTGKRKSNHITILEVLTTIIFVRIWRIFTCHESLDSEAKPVSEKLGKESWDRVFATVVCKSPARAAGEECSPVPSPLLSIREFTVQSSGLSVGPSKLG